VSEEIPDGELETALEMSAALRAGDVTSAELVERSLRRLEAWQPSINAFSQIWADDAVEGARRAGERPGPESGRLRGVPGAVKDLFDVGRHETTGCCDAYRGRLASVDASVIAAIRRAGVVFVGKTNQHELAAGGTNLVSACGPTGNPWDPARMTGGSSGGSAAAVAAGIVPMALGSDTGGSVRIPASMCGCFGLKPTHWRFPLDGVMPLAPSMDCPGPIASTAADLSAAYDSMDPRDRADDGALALEPDRIGVPEGGFFGDVVNDETLGTVRIVAEAFAGGGAVVESIDGGGLRDVRAVWMTVTTPEFWEAHPTLRGEALALVSPQPRAWLEQGSRTTSAERAEAARRRSEVRRWFGSRLQRFDALLVPTTAYPAPPADQRTVDLGAAGAVDTEEFGPGFLTCSVNLAGLPAVNLPAGRSSDGMPMGVSLVGRDHAERDLLRMAERWEELTTYRAARPPLPVP
jgi:Asp-tRNA(Asn)/Glu-tRNA(Gln) amidotransferase A subunit family amidase